MGVKSKGDVAWYLPDGRLKAPVAYSTTACSLLIVELSLLHHTIQDVYDAIEYDREAKGILKIYINKGFGDYIAKDYFK